MPRLALIYYLWEVIQWYIYLYSSVPSDGLCLAQQVTYYISPVKKQGKKKETKISCPVLQKKYRKENRPSERRSKMSNPAFWVGIRTPLGLLAIGGLGYILYKIGGKKKNRSTEEDEESLSDKAVKGAIKTVCKAKLGVEKALEEKKKRFSEMWSEAKEDMREKG